MTIPYNCIWLIYFSNIHHRKDIQLTLIRKMFCPGRMHQTNKYVQVKVMNRCYLVDLSKKITNLYATVYDIPQLGYHNIIYSIKTY